MVMVTRNSSTTICFLLLFLSTRIPLCFVGVCTSSTNIKKNTWRNFVCITKCWKARLETRVLILAPNKNRKILINEAFPHINYHLAWLYIKHLYFRKKSYVIIIIIYYNNQCFDQTGSSSNFQNASSAALQITCQKVSNSTHTCPWILGRRRYYAFCG